MLECDGAIVVVNPSPEEGRTGSLQIGLISLVSELGRTPEGTRKSGRPLWLELANR